MGYEESEYFDEWIATACPASTAIQRHMLKDAVDKLCAAGGIPLNPFLDSYSELILRFKEDNNDSTHRE